MVRVGGGDTSAKNTLSKKRENLFAGTQSRRVRGKTTKLIGCSCQERTRKTDPQAGGGARVIRRKIYLKKKKQANLQSSTVKGEVAVLSVEEKCAGERRREKNGGFVSHSIG